MDQYLFLDRSALQPQGMDNLKLTVAHIEKDTEHNPLFHEDFFSDPPRKWEVRYDNAYPNVIYDPKYRKYRCYYTLCSKDDDSASAGKEERARRAYRPMPTRIASLGYAESDDGVHWVKPSLGLVDFEGSTDNNMLFRYAHGTGVFLDEAEADPARRYKLVTKVEYPGGRTYMAVNFSEDGVHWGEMIQWPRNNPPADSHNFPFRDKVDGLFKVITRTWKNGVRISSICSSRDFINWSEPREILRGDGFESQVYSMPVFWYNGIYLGLASMFHEGDRSAPNFDTVDCELTYAATTDKFDRVAPYQYLIPRGQGSYPTGDFDCCCIYAAAPIDMGDRLCFYYMGGNGQHTNFRETSFARGFLKKDRFAWYEPREADREAVLPTCRMNIYGNHLSVLADVEDGGSLTAAICPSWKDAPYQGFGYKDCVLTPGKDGYTRISFRNKKLMDLENATACVVFRFRNARLYGLRGEVVRQGERYYEGAPTL